MNINTHKQKLGQVLVVIQVTTGLSVRGFSKKARISSKTMLTLQEGRGYQERGFVNRMFKYVPDIDPELKTQLEECLCEIEKVATTSQKRMGPTLRSALA